MLANYYTARAQIIRDTIAGLAITTVTLHVFLLVFPLGLWIAFAQGILNNDYVRCLPFLIEKAAVFGVLYGIAFSLIYACQGKHGEQWRTRIESVLHPVPLLGTARKYLALSRLASALEALIGAGVSIIRSWELAGDASGSPAVANASLRLERPARKRRHARRA